MFTLPLQANASQKGREAGVHEIGVSRQLPLREPVGGSILPWFQLCGGITSNLTGKDKERTLWLPHLVGDMMGYSFGL